MRLLPFGLALGLLLVGTPSAGGVKVPEPIFNAAKAAATHKPLGRLSAPETRELLLAIAEHESRFRMDVARCKVRGDGGRAHGSYQLHPEAFGGHSAEDVCADDGLQARLALAVLHAAFKRTGTIGGAVRSYASGTAKDTRAAREIMQIFQRRRRALSLPVRLGPNRRSVAARREREPWRATGLLGSPHATRSAARGRRAWPAPLVRPRA